MTKKFIIKSITEINQAPMDYWSLTKYSDSIVNQVCTSLDKNRLFCRIQFQKKSPPIFTVSQKTWEIQQGHYPSILKFFTDVSEHPFCSEASGSLIIWLEDGLYEHDRDFTKNIPILAFGRSVKDTKTFLIPDPAFIETSGYIHEIEEINNLEFEKKTSLNEKKKIVFWRGAATGLGIEDKDWIKTQRGFLCLKSNEIANSEIIDAKFTKIDHLSLKQQIKLVKANVVSEYVSFNDFLNYYYLVNADGYSCAWKSLFLKLASKSVTLIMQSNIEQWYFRKILPWVHFVPLNNDASDIEDIHEWLITHPLECIDIVENANKFIAEMKYEVEVENTAKLAMELMDLKIS